MELSREEEEEEKKLLRAAGHLHSSTNKTAADFLCENSIIWRKTVSGLVLFRTIKTHKHAATILPHNSLM